MKASKMEFTRAYADKSGIANCVRLEGTYVEVKSDESICIFDNSELKWLIAALTRIKKEVDKKK